MFWVTLKITFFVVFNNLFFRSLLIMDTILSTFQGDAVRVVGYADDILLMIGGADPGSLVQGHADKSGIFGCKITNFGFSIG